MPFELRPYPNETLRPEGDYLQRAWRQSVYPIARRMGVPITLPTVSPQPHSHLAFEGFQYAREHGRGNEYNHRVLSAFFVGEPEHRRHRRADEAGGRGRAGREGVRASAEEPQAPGRPTGGPCGTPTRRRASPASPCS